MKKKSADLSFRRLIATSMAAKFVVDIGSQIFNPFLPLIAAGLGLGVVELGRIVGLRSAMGILSPISGALSDRFGFRLIIRVSLLLMAAACLLFAASTSLWITISAIVLLGMGTSAFVPNLQAYISSLLPYKLRARGLGMIEYSWALTGIAGLSLIGLLIAAKGWRAPFYLLAAAMALMSFVFGALPGEKHSKPQHHPEGYSHPTWGPALLSIVKLHENRRSAYATILAGMLSYFASMQVMITHGAWLAGRYGMDAATLGLVAFVLGCFDLAASVAVSVFTDRIGKKRSVVIGIAGSLVAYMAMPFLDSAIIPAVTIIAVARMFFEFNIVAHFSLLSEQAPKQRGRAMTLGAAALGLAGSLAGFTGPWLYVNRGVSTLAWTSALAVLIALGVTAFFVRENSGELPFRADLNHANKA